MSQAKEKSSRFLATIANRVANRNPPSNLIPIGMLIRTSMRDAAPALAEIFGATNVPAEVQRRPSETVGKPAAARSTHKTPKGLSASQAPPKTVVGNDPKQENPTHPRRPEKQQPAVQTRQEPGTAAITMTPRPKKSRHQCSTCGRPPSAHAKLPLSIPTQANACEHTDEAVRRDKKPRHTRAERLARASLGYSNYAAISG